MSVDSSADLIVIQYLFYGVFSVVACTLLCESGSTGSIPVRHPNFYAKIAQLVEHRSEESGVVGSIPTLGTIQTPALSGCAVNNLTLYK